MKKLMLIITAMLLVTFTGTAVWAQEEKDTEKEQLITLELKDSPIRVALDTLFLGRGMNYVIDQSVQGTVSSINLRDVTFDQALKVILKSVTPPLVYRKDGNVYIISVKKEEPVDVAPSSYSPPVPSVPDEPIPANEVKLEKIALNFIDAFDLKDLIDGVDVRGSGFAGGFGGYGGGMGGFGNNFGGFGSGFGGFNNGGYGGFNSGYGGYGGYNSGYGASYGGNYGTTGTGGFGIGGYRGSRSGY